MLSAEFLDRQTRLGKDPQGAGGQRRSPEVSRSRTNPTAKAFSSKSCLCPTVTDRWWSSQRPRSLLGSEPDDGGQQPCERAPSAGGGGCAYCQFWSSYRYFWTEKIQMKRYFQTPCDSDQRFFLISQYSGCSITKGRFVTRLYTAWLRNDVS